MIRSGSRSIAAGYRCCLAALTLGALLAAGCAVFRREPLDVPPGHRLVSGGVDIARFGESLPLQVPFEVVDAPAVYVGTLLIERVAFAGSVRTAARDDYDRTVSEIRARHPELPAVAARSLMGPD